MSEASLLVETTSGKVPLAQYQQWQALAESAAQQRGDRAVRKVELGQGTALPCMICNAGPCIRTKKYFCRFPGAPAGAASGMQLHMQLRQWQMDQQQGLGPGDTMQQQRMGPSLSASSASWDNRDPSNALLHSLLSEAVSKTLSTTTTSASTLNSMRTKSRSGENGCDPRCVL